MVAVSLKDIVNQLEMLSDDTLAYLNPKTGELYALSDEEREMLEDEGFDEKDLPPWQRPLWPKMREVFDSGEFLVLPTKYDIHEWEIMNRFAVGQTGQRRREELLDAIHGKGAFRMFKSTIYRMGIEQQWFAFRQAALEEIAQEWLEEHDIPIKPSVIPPSGI
jgi:hypothetical protein